MSKTWQVVPFQDEHLPRLIEITLEGFSGVSVDFLIEENFGIVEPGWEVRKAVDIRCAAKQEPQGIFVATTVDEVVGYVTVATSSEKRIGRIADLVVNKRYQRQGVGTSLIEFAISYIRNVGMCFAKIETLTANASGQAAYSKLGFTEVARQIHYVMPLDGE